MAYDEGLAQRVRELLEERAGFDEKKMFGGICFLLHGNMSCGIIEDDLIVRVGKERYEECLSQAHTRKFDVTGRPMTGWVMVSYEGYESDQELSKWVEKGVSLVLTLPLKPGQ